MEFKDEIYVEADRVLHQLYQYCLIHGIEFPIKQINEHKDAELPIVLKELVEKDNRLFRAYLAELKTIVGKAETVTMQNLKKHLSDENKYPLEKSRVFFSIEAMRRFLFFIDWMLQENKEDFLKDHDIYMWLKHSEVYSGG